MSAKAGQLDETFVQGDSVRTETVTFSRDELASAIGRESIERRIRRAAEKVCGPLGYRLAGSLRNYMRNKKCYDQALAEAMSQIGTEQVVTVVR